MKKERKRLVKKLDDICSQYIRERDKKCFICGTKENLQNGHLFSRASYSTRWDELNCHAQCSSCNYRHEFDFEPYRAKFVYEYGNEKYDNLYKKYRAIVKYSNFDLENLINYFNEKKSKLKNEE